MSVPVVEIENLVKRYQELVALDHFNSQLRKVRSSVCWTKRLRKDDNHQLHPCTACL